MDLTAADGTVRRCEDHVALLPAPGGEFVGSACVLRDVTERHERERRLSRERDRVRLPFDRTPIPVVRFRLDDGVPVVEETTPAFDLTFGETPEPGVPVDEVHVPDDEREAAARINRRIRAGDPVEAEVTRETVDGRREFLAHVATSETDGVVEGYASYVDVTEQAAYEAALARQTRWLEGFADVFSHDLRNPLNTARGNVDLGALARAVWATPDADAAALDAGDAPAVRADRLAVKRLLGNLLRNALDHGGPTVRVAVTGVEAAHASKRQGFLRCPSIPVVPDEYYNRAKQEGYRSRAAYKLRQIDETADVLPRAGVVVDVGAAPGGWLQVAAERVGPRGRVVGVDRQRIDAVEKTDDRAHVETVRGDVTEEETRSRLLDAVGEDGADAVVSDIAPNMTGEYSLDHARSVHLARIAFETALDCLRPGGEFVAKVFDGPDLADLRSDLESEFEYVREVRPDASRDSSSELYLVAKGRVTAPVEAGEVRTFEVEDVGREGDGIARVDGYTVFVPDAGVGDEVRARVTDVKPNYAFTERVD